MFYKGNCVSGVQTVALAAALLACSSETFAQHGGGGRMGGGASTAGGRPTGVDAKDDLKDFKEAIAVQASSQQAVDFKLMLKSTEAASAESKALVDEVASERKASEIALRDKTLLAAIEAARTANKSFIEEFSDRQKTGLKDITKKLKKADSDLEQQAKTLDRKVEANLAGSQMAASAQKLNRALANFGSQQLGLGEKMGIENGDNTQVITFKIAPINRSVSVGNHPLTITTSGAISTNADEGSQKTFKLHLIVDMAELQENITEILRAELNKADSCGEQVTIQSATLTPRDPASIVVVHLHFERWTCRSTNSINEIAEGNGTLELKLTPAVGPDGGLQLLPEFGHVDADGLLSELLRSGSLGDALRDKIKDSILSIAQQGGDFKATLPPAAQGNAVLRQARFESTGSGRLTVVLDGDIRVSTDKAISLASEMKSQIPSQEAMPR
jgi:hypothetical protein